MDSAWIWIGRGTWPLEIHLLPTCQLHLCLGNLRPSSLGLEMMDNSPCGEAAVSHVRQLCNCPGWQYEH